MRWLARLRRRKAGATPWLINAGELARFQPGMVIDGESLAAQHNEAERVMRSLQARLASLEDEHRELVGAVDELRGRANSTSGDPIELHMKRAGVDHG